MQHALIWQARRWAGGVLYVTITKKAGVDWDPDVTKALMED